MYKPMQTPDALPRRMWVKGLETTTRWKSFDGVVLSKYCTAGTDSYRFGKIGTLFLMV
jgi:hypothetical protein